jgi:hypothetical protein
MIEFLSPEGRRTQRSIERPDLLSSVAGTSIGLLEVPFANTALYLDEAVAALEQAHGPIRVAKRYSKPEVSVPTPEDVLDEFAAECDFVISAYGH